MKTDKIYLVGFMATRQDHGRPRARRPSRAGARGHRRADREARTADRRRDLRQARRAVLSCGRTRNPAAPPADASSGRGHRRRHVRRSGEPRDDQPRRRLGLDRRAARGYHRANPARRTPAARRRPCSSSSGSTRRASSPTGRRRSASTDRACPPPAIVRRDPRSRSAAPAVPLPVVVPVTSCAISSSATSTRISTPSTPCWPTPRTLGYDAVLCLGDLVGYGGESRPRSLAACSRWRRSRWSAAIMTRCAQASNLRCSSTRSPGASIEWTRRDVVESRNSDADNLPKGPASSTTRSRSATARPSTKTHYVFEPDDAARAIDAASARICLFGHTHLPAIFTAADDPESTGGRTGG